MADYDGTGGVAGTGLWRRGEWKPWFPGSHSPPLFDSAAALRRWSPAAPIMLASPSFARAGALPESDSLGDDRRHQAMDADALILGFTGFRLASLHTSRQLRSASRPFAIASWIVCRRTCMPGCPGDRETPRSPLSEHPWGLKVTLMAGFGLPRGIGAVSLTRHWREASETRNASSEQFWA